ncbi:hypothetical protein ACFRAI_01160 [Streptomyces sp. NPDC056637]|uniref:hypothetical protein n=1 Tax=unclassified Streptomyces TaxID=2593676 RepID=UPI003634EC86
MEDGGEQDREEGRRAQPVRLAIVTDDVERILGRPPRTFAMWAEEHKGAFV